MPPGGFRLLAQAVPLALPHVVRSLYATCSIRLLNRGVKEEYIDALRPFVGVVWHQDFVFVLDYFRRRKIVVMVSRSKDGDLVARLLHRLGYRTVRGSSSLGGREALCELTDLVREGWGSAIIADGPRGPAREAKVGCVVAARDSGAPILTMGCAVTPSWRARNWDRTVLPKPFARIVVGFGAPLTVERDADHARCEDLRREVTRRMEALEATCREVAGPS